MEKLRQLADTLGTSRPSFEPVKSEESLLPSRESHDVEDTEVLCHDSRRPRKQWGYWTLGILFLLLYSASLVILGASTHKLSDRQCSDQLSMWSPLNQAVEYTDTRVENAFAQESKYRGPPTPELEKAWDLLWHVAPVPFPKEKLAAVNATNELPDGRFLQTTSEDTEDLSGQFEVFHQLHCLNLIRQYTWRDWYFRHPEIVKTPFAMLESDVGARLHVDHCIEALRISLQCHGDTTPFFTISDEKAPLGARADFSPQRKCRNYDKLLEWTKEREIVHASHDFHPSGGQTDS